MENLCWNPIKITHILEIIYPPESGSAEGKRKILQETIDFKWLQTAGDISGDEFALVTTPDEFSLIISHTIKEEISQFIETTQHNAHSASKSSNIKTEISPVVIQLLSLIYKTDEQNINRLKLTHSKTNTLPLLKIYPSVTIKPNPSLYIPNNQLYIQLNGDNLQAIPYLKPEYFHFSPSQYEVPKLVTNELNLPDEEYTGKKGSYFTLSPNPFPLVANTIMLQLNEGFAWKGTEEGTGYGPLKLLSMTIPDYAGRIYFNGTDGIIVGNIDPPEDINNTEKKDTAVNEDAEENNPLFPMIPQQLEEETLLKTPAENGEAAANLQDIFSFNVTTVVTHKHQGHVNLNYVLFSDVDHDDKNGKKTTSQQELRNNFLRHEPLADLHEDEKELRVQMRKEKQKKRAMQRKQQQHYQQIIKSMDMNNNKEKLSITDRAAEAQKNEGGISKPKEEQADQEKIPTSALFSLVDFGNLPVKEPVKSREKKKNRKFSALATDSNSPPNSMNQDITNNNNNEETPEELEEKIRKRIKTMKSRKRFRPLAAATSSASASTDSATTSTANTEGDSSSPKGGKYLRINHI